MGLKDVEKKNRRVHRKWACRFGMDKPLDADVFTVGAPGSFIAVYGVFDGRVPRTVIATGNNP